MVLGKTITSVSLMSVMASTGCEPPRNKIALTCPLNDDTKSITIVRGHRTALAVVPGEPNFITCDVEAELLIGKSQIGDMIDLKMLGKDQLVAFVPSTDGAAARAFATPGQCLVGLCTETQTQGGRK